MDHTNHIEQKILVEYFGKIEPSSIPFHSIPFPTNNNFEMELFQALPGGYPAADNGSPAIAGYPPVCQKADC